MADDPIRVSSTGWTGLPAKPAKPALRPRHKPLPSPFKVIVCSIGLMAIGAYGAWDALESGRAACLPCTPYTAAADTAQFSVIVVVRMLCVPAGVWTLFLGIRDAWREFRNRTSRSAETSEKSAR